MPLSKLMCGIGLQSAPGKSRWLWVLRPVLGAEAWPVCLKTPFLLLLLSHWHPQTYHAPSLQGPDLCLVGLAYVLCDLPSRHTGGSDNSIRGGHVGLHPAQALVLSLRFGVNGQVLWYLVFIKPLPCARYYARCPAEEGSPVLQ